VLLKIQIVWGLKKCRWGHSPTTWRGVLEYFNPKLKMYIRYKL